MVLSIPFAAVTLGTLALYFVADQTLEALRRSMQFSDIWMDADRAALLQLDRCVDIGGNECDLVKERLTRPLAYLRAIQERSKPHPDLALIERSLKEAGIDASPTRFRLRWFERVSQLAGLSSSNLESEATQNSRMRGETPGDIKGIFNFTSRARAALAHSPPDRAALAVLKQQIAAFRSSLELAKARFDANSAAASHRLRRMLYVLVAGCVFAMYGIATWLFRRMITDWQKAEVSFRERDQRLSHELNLHVRQLEIALADKNLLLREVQHRVKNNLQLISSLTSLQARQVADGSTRNALFAIRDRAKSMSLIHESLCFSGTLAHIDFSKFVDSLCSQLIRSYAPNPNVVQLHTDVDALLKLDEAIPCGLIINELLSNALKYAFTKSGGRGDIWISFHQLGDQFLLEVRDNGVGMPAEFSLDAGRTLGIRVVSDLAAQLHASFGWTNDHGAVFRVEFRRQSELQECPPPNASLVPTMKST